MHVGGQPVGWRTTIQPHRLRHFFPTLSDIGPLDVGSRTSVEVRGGGSESQRAGRVRVRPCHHRCANSARGDTAPRTQWEAPLPASAAAGVLRLLAPSRSGRRALLATLAWTRSASPSILGRIRRRLRPDRMVDPRPPDAWRPLPRDPGDLAELRRLSQKGRAYLLPSDEGATHTAGYPRDGQNRFRESRQLDRRQLPNQSENDRLVQDFLGPVPRPTWVIGVDFRSRSNLVRCVQGVRG